MAGYDDFSNRRTGWVQTGAATAALVLSVALVAWMALLVLRGVDDLSTANSDNVQWSLAQADVEFLRFRIALRDAEEDPTALESVRRRFDVFYSRMATIESGEMYRAMRDDPQFRGPRTRVRDFLSESVPFIDSPDADLRASLPLLAERAEQVNEDVRSFSLAALTAYAGISDDRREGVMQLLAYLGIVLAVLFVALAMVAFTLFRLFRLAQGRAHQVESAAGRMRTIVETSPNAIVVFDKSGAIREFNPAAERMFGYTRAEARGRSAMHLLLPHDEAEAQRHGAFAFAEQLRRPRLEERHFEVTVRSRDGRLFPAEFAIDRSEAGLPLYVAYIRDISRRKNDEAELREARDRALAGERVKSEFLAVMSHEMRTPLNGLLGTMQLLHDQPLSPRQADLLERMQASGELLLGLVNDVLDLAKFEAGKMKAESEPFSITQLLDGVMHTAGPVAESYGNTLSWQWVGAPRDGVEGDMRRLRHVLLNLVGNAAKFTRQGEIEVEVECLPGAESMVEFRVSDSGIGIAEEDLERVFNDFETLDSSYARETGGTGLGLGIARRFVKLMGGEIGAESEPGEGSLFWFRVPLAPTQAVVERLVEAWSAPEDTGAPLDVLLVEDNEINRFIVREMLDSAGHSVVEAENGREGVDQAARHRFDVILMDISMPIMDGTEAVQHIRGGDGASRNTPIVALTAHALPEERARFHRLGMEACLNKPVERQKLLATLRAAAAGENAEAPAVEAAPASEPLIDDTVLAHFHRNVPQEAGARLLARFFDEMDDAVITLAKSGPDAADLAATAHKCAGSCGTFGAEAMRAALIRIEARIKRGERPAQGDLAALQPLWSRSRAELEARMAAA